MGYSATTVRLETDLKKKFDAVCKSMGMNANVAINIFARAVVRDQCIPFSVESPEKKKREEAMAAFMEIRKKVESPTFPDITDEEIEQEIAEYRSGK